MKSSELDKKSGACGAYAILCCPHEWLLIASRPGQGLGLVGPPSRTRFDRVCPWPLPGPETGSFLVQGSLDRPCLPFDGVEVVTMGCCFARTSQAEAGDLEFQSGPRCPSLTVMGLI